MPDFVLAVRLGLALVFALAGVSKIADRQGGKAALEGFGISTAIAGPTAIVLPVVELTTAGCLLVPATAWWALLGCLGLLGVFAAAIANSMARGLTPECHCFGEIHSAPVGLNTLLRNAILAAAAAAALLAGQGAAKLNPAAWVTHVDIVPMALAAVVLVLLLVGAAEGWFLLELLRQHGRILKRLEHLEARHGTGVAPTPIVPGAATQPRVAGHAEALAIGQAAPEFKLPALAGGLTSLSDLLARRRPVLLLFSDPGCRPCNALLPDAARWQRDLAENLTVALVSRGTREQNLVKAREHGLDTVLLQDDREVAATYHTYGTPSAVVLSPEGKITGSVAQGAPAVTQLVNTWSAPTSPRAPAAAHTSYTGHGESWSAETALRPGCDASALRWQDIDGRTIALGDLRGDLVVLLFWNSRCGFCRRMLPELRRWESRRAEGSPQLVVIASGDSQTNRQQGLRSPIVLEDRPVTRARFGVIGTPSAVMLDSRGRVTGQVQVGADAVLGLLNAPTRTRASEFASAPEQG